MALDQKHLHAMGLDMRHAAWSEACAEALRRGRKK